ncbi:hypothetical protein PL11_009130 [Lentilactobacillus curieae]|uniref:Cell wall elongation regulator TseB-like domain-containing protein n=1 Tax=Lentilactobacillus curieae TaxID=1138822 RepID=A0A1S6QKE5_9LACO|nr:DUF5590 domain-containing protein [Lentilactobacillus curieae]AQW22069.1 hypothetical protein PL11_009130 [Lentilactobacillus curieae]
MQRQRRIKKSNRKFWIGLILFLLIVLFSVFIVFHQAEKPMVTAKSEALQIAQKYAGIKNVNGFYNSNLGKTYYSVSGNDKRGKAIYVVIAKKGGKVTIIDQKSGLTADQIKQSIENTKKPKKINGIAITLKKSKPYWVVSYVNKSGKLCFATTDFKTGKIKKLIANI